MSENHPLYRMPSPFETEIGMLLLLEPPWANEGKLRAQLKEGSYEKPFIVDDGERRYLYFNVHLMQSAMQLKAPNLLDLRYTQKMMSFLLFNPRPKRITFIGLGGGSLVKFCHHRLTSTELTVIELDANVIALREAFMIPPDGPRLQIIQGEGGAYLQNPEHRMDTLLVDAFDGVGFAPQLANREFLENAFARLTDQGILVVNLAGERETYAGLIGLALDVFDDQVITMSVPEDGNTILLAFKDRYFEPRWRWLHNHSKELRAKYGLDFPDFVEKLERSAKLSLAKRAR